jgi:hypothetical protein
MIYFDIIKFGIKNSLLVHIKFSKKYTLQIQDNKCYIFKNNLWNARFKLK